MQSGIPDGFVPTSNYSWKFIDDAPGSTIPQFDPSLFELSVFGFGSPAGTFNITNGGSWDMEYTGGSPGPTAPEPATVIGLIGILAAAARRRARNGNTKVS